MIKRHVSSGLCIVILALLTACGVKENVVFDTTDKSSTVGITAPVATTAPITEAPEATKVPSSPKDSKASLAEGDITYKMNELSFVKAPRTEYTIQEDGSVEVRFKQKDYAEIRFMLPERIDLNECAGITVKLRADYAVKIMLLGKSILWNRDCPAFYEEYICAEGMVAGYYVIPHKFEEVYGIVIAPAEEIDDFELYKAAAYSVTFHAKSAGELPSNARSVPKEIAPDVTDDMTLLNTYGTVIDKIGVSVTVDELQKPALLKMIKEQYNTISSGLEAKQDAILRNPVTLISVEEAKKIGYVIPDAYKELEVPMFNFSVLDEILRICAENDLYYRFHTLIWHEATYKWFFREGYSITGEYVTSEVMNARMELYIRTVMEHVCNSPYGYVVYAWDVVNEHLHADALCSDWIKIYGEERLEPAYVKHAYKVADDVLRKYGIRDTVALIYNDYETYLTINGRDMTQDIIAVLDYVNSDGMICDTVGMQTHLNTDVPIARKQKRAILEFLDAGYKVQFTETDICIKIPETGKEDQEKYYCEFMKTVLEIAQSGGAITGLTFFGTSDSVSWLREYSPLMFTCPGRAKDVYYMVLQTYLDIVESVTFYMTEPMEKK